MPELPEVETTRSGIAHHIINQPVRSVTVRQSRLRWQVPRSLKQELPGHFFHAVTRRGKYLLLSSDAGTLLIHLGMSGSLRILPGTSPVRKHDHIDLQFESGSILRFTDPRRFGCMLWFKSDPMNHPLLTDLGPEPLSMDFDGHYLKARSRHKKQAIKNFIMDSKVVVGVGNIYANEALFASGIRPGKAAGRITLARYQLLAEKIKAILHQAIKLGGTTLRDFTDSDGQPGYFSQSLMVYGRDRQLCRVCNQPIRVSRLGQRSTFYCPHCQA
ncbi:MAG: bifunctional DNA-formamidopyrimidine glycosylase/DNA-(apurinic or apyrimidinic site) lyase [Pseudohongiellaceae bacterium]